MSDNSINSPTFTELELSGIAIVLYLLISPIHGISKITEPILKMFNIKSATSLLFFTGFLFGVIYYFSIELVLHPMYKKLRAVGFKVGGQHDITPALCGGCTYPVEVDGQSIGGDGLCHVAAIAAGYDHANPDSSKSDQACQFACTSGKYNSEDVQRIRRDWKKRYNKLKKESPGIPQLETATDPKIIQLTTELIRDHGACNPWEYDIPSANASEAVGAGDSSKRDITVNQICHAKNDDSPSGPWKDFLANNTTFTDWKGNPDQCIGIGH